MRLLIVSAALVALAACASVPTYAPAVQPGGPGYSEMQIESDRYVVTYRAGASAEASLLEDYALLRAAELTLAHGHDWFWVVRRDFESGRDRYSGPSIGIGVGGGSWGGHGGASVGVGVNIPVGGQRGSARAARLEIRFGQGPKPDEANAYDARSISANVRARLAPN